MKQFSTSRLIPLSYRISSLIRYQLIMGTWFYTAVMCLIIITSTLSFSFAVLAALRCEGGGGKGGGGRSTYTYAHSTHVWTFALFTGWTHAPPIHIHTYPIHTGMELAWSFRPLGRISTQPCGAGRCFFRTTGRPSHHLYQQHTKLRFDEMILL